jgi:Zn-dependent protease with chaperone function
MDFFKSQEQARSNSRRLVGLFVLAVTGIVVALNVVAGMVFSGLHADTGTLLPGLWWYRQNLPIVASVTGASLALIFAASAFRIASLRSGGSAVAEALGGTRIAVDTRNPLERRLRNVVEEMSIASALPVPEIYVLQQETGINAFAAGFTQSDAAVAVTRGALEQLNRDELQGVIAHEFSHILNGDMRLNLRLVGILFGILVIGQLGRLVLRSGRFGNTGGDSSGRNRIGSVAVVMALGLALFLIGYIGVFFGRMIKASVSRQREYLADSSAVQFTRQSAGIAGALKKIAGIGAGSRMRSVGAEEISHMLFASGTRFFSSLMATHPPIEERIRALDPAFKGIAADSAKARAKMPGAAGLAGSALTGSGVAGLAGNPDSAGISLAAGLLQQLPESIAEDLQSTTAAPKLLLALLLSEDIKERDSQLSLLAGRLGPATAEEIARNRQLLGDFSRQLRLPILELCFPSLRRLSPPKRLFYLGLGRELVERDNHVDYQEFALLQVLGVYLRDLEHPGRRTRSRHSRHKIVPATARVFALLARAGQADEALAEQAYQQAMQTLLPGIPRVQHPEWSQQDSDLGQVSDDLSLLDGLPPHGKRRLIETMTDLVLQDQRAGITELEILRCFAASLHIPLPPMEPTLGVGRNAVRPTAT